MSGVVFVVCPFADDGKLKNIHVDLALLVWDPTLLSTHAPLPPLNPLPSLFLFFLFFPPPTWKSRQTQVSFTYKSHLAVWRERDVYEWDMSNNMNESCHTHTHTHTHHTHTTHTHAHIFVLNTHTHTHPQILCVTRLIHIWHTHTHTHTHIFIYSF